MFLIDERLERLERGLGCLIFISLVLLLGVVAILIWR